MNRILTTLSEKWPEYLLEIFVLIIGIYGAFAVDNWNENRKCLKDEQALYDQLLLDYEANLAQLEQKIFMHEQSIKSGFAILQAIDYPENINYDSLTSHLAIFSIDPTFDPIANDLVGSGKINLIQNPELNRFLSNWESDFVAFKEIELMWQGRVYDQLLSILIELGINRDVDSQFWKNGTLNSVWLLDKESSGMQLISKSKSPPELKDILENKPLEGIVSHGIQMNQAAAEQGIALKKRIEHTISLLNSKKKK
ncbi:MAG: hypothetical protein ABJG41_12510 [Cyclobacteriaceae bacterium]